ncbi:umecyanin [Cajanus cajan]|uniref:Blue copper protein n=1 Tax=Cajanus cajan TaxID=3821 RepID=A0A151QZR9_CAJCA|nr:umecyanin [Cajanus cajan]KYP35797.1 Blue copper protein [Cajanus cajan]
MARNMGLNLIGCSMVAMIFIIGATEATDYIVGDSFGWNVPTNESFYIDWASNKRFFVGDTLFFNWSGDHTVGIERDSSNYENCNTSAVGNLIGSSFRYTLLEAVPQYFICTVGNHCVRGQKFSINVESLNSDAPTYPQPGSDASTLSFGILSAFISSFALYVGLYM